MYKSFKDFSIGDNCVVYDDCKNFTVKRIQNIESKWANDHFAAITFDNKDNVLIDMNKIFTKFYYSYLGRVIGKLNVEAE